MAHFRPGVPMGHDSVGGRDMHVTAEDVEKMRLDAVRRRQEAILRHNTKPSPEGVALIEDQLASSPRARAFERIDTEIMDLAAKRIGARGQGRLAGLRRALEILQAEGLL